MDAGDVFAERFEIERVAGSGGMGVVYRARDRLTGKLVALKMLLDGDASSKRFAREARALAELDHPCIVRSIASGTHEGRAFLAMEWLDGRTSQRVSREVRSTCVTPRPSERVWRTRSPRRTLAASSTET